MPAMRCGEENIHYLLQIECLLVGICIEFLGIKPGTGAELQCFLPEIRLYGFVHLIFAVCIDDVIQRSTGKVTEQGSLGVGTGFHLVQQIEQGMMTESREAGGNATDIYQIIGSTTMSRG